MLIHIIGRNNAAGLSTDIQILTNLFLNQGWKVHFSDYKSLKRFSFWSADKYDLNIFLQWANPTWMKLARKNILIPNPEWFKDKWVKVIPEFDAIFCKTRIATTIFKNRNPHTFFTSFTSKNRHAPEIAKKNQQWLHLAGKSKLKGTQVIIKTWLANPDFPHLTIIQRNTATTENQARNLTYISEFIDHEDLQLLMNQCPVHICTSATEGFGHSIGEALSCGAIVITTDASPMNELVNDERGFLVKPVNKRMMRLATAYDIDQQGLEKAVRKAMHRETESLLGENARDFFISNDHFFKKEMIKQVQALMD
jgi:glycosyltransferase involved in cell wall biosynthesis